MMDNKKTFLKEKIAEMSLADKILIVINIICFVITSVYIFTGSIEYFTSDSASYNILGRESYLTGSIYPEDWNTSTSVMGLGPNILIWFFSNFFSDQILIRNLSVFVFFIILTISFVYTSKVLKSRSFLIIAPVLFIGFSGVYKEMLYSQAAYIMSVCISVLLPALFIASIADKNKIRPLSLILFVVLYTMYGHNSITIVQQVTIPLVAAVLLYVFFRVYNDKKLDLRDDRKLLLLTAAFIMVALINFVVYKKIIEPSSLKQAYNSNLTVMMNSDKILSNLTVFFQSVLLISGFEFGANILSFSGIFALIKIVCAAALLVYFPIRLAKRYKEQSDPVKLFILYSFVHVIEVFIICFWGTLPDMYAGARYMISSAVLLCILGGYYLYTYIISEKTVLSAAYLLIYCAYLGAGAVPTLQSSANYQNILSDKKSLSEFLYDNNLTYGYATFWNAGNNSVLSDFKVQINPVTLNDQGVSAYYWLCVGRYFDPDNYNGDSFLLLTDSEAAQYESTSAYSAFGTPQEVLHYNGYSVYVYSYNISENNFKGQRGSIIGKEISLKLSEYNEDILGSGWSDLEDWGVWSVGNENILYFGLPEDISGNLEMSIDLFSFHEPRDVDIYINDEKLETINVAVDSSTYSISIPESYYQNGASYGSGKLMTVKFTQTAELSPHDIDENLPDTRQLGLGMSRLSITQQ